MPYHMHINLEGPNVTGPEDDDGMSIICHPKSQALRPSLLIGSAKDPTQVSPMVELLNMEASVLVSQILHTLHQLGMVSIALYTS